MSLSRAGAGIAAAALGGLAVLGMQSTATAAPKPDCPVGQHYAPTSGCTDNGASVDHRNFNPGQPGKIKSPGFKPGSMATLTLFSTPVVLGTFPANGDGEVDADFTIPAATPAGEHHLELSGVDAQGRTVNLAVPVTVAGAVMGSGAGSGGAGGNGAELGLISAAGVIVLVAGGGAVYVSRRRQAA